MSLKHLSNTPHIETFLFQRGPSLDDWMTRSRVKLWLLKHTAPEQHVAYMAPLGALYVKPKRKASECPLHPSRLFHWPGREPLPFLRRASKGTAKAQDHYGEPIAIGKSLVCELTYIQAVLRNISRHWSKQALAIQQNWLRIGSSFSLCGCDNLLVWS